MRHKSNEKYRRKQNIMKHKNLLSHIRMGKEILKFDEPQIEKDTFCHYKSL